MLEMRKPNFNVQKPHKSGSMLKAFAKFSKNFPASHIRSLLYYYTTNAQKSF